MTLGYDELFLLLRDQGALIAATPESALALTVPAVPTWSAEQVLRHTAQVHRWVVEVLRAGQRADLGTIEKSLASAPKGPASIPHYQESLQALVDEFEHHDPDEPCLSFIGPATTGWWMRRQAYEVLVHRHDIESAHLRAPAVTNPRAAADGVDEWVVNYAPRVALRDSKAPPASLLGKRLALVAADLPGTRWVLRSGEDLAQADPDDPADATLSLPAWELLLTVWRRRPLDMTAVTGETFVAQEAYEYVRI
jgi:uncharacterized protein (TIGR03083 family)